MAVAAVAVGEGREKIFRVLTLSRVCRRGLGRRRRRRVVIAAARGFSFLFRLGFCHGD